MYSKDEILLTSNEEVVGGGRNTLKNTLRSDPSSVSGAEPEDHMGLVTICQEADDEGSGR